MIDRRGFFARLAAVAALPLVPFMKPKPEITGGFVVPEHLIPGMVALMKVQQFPVPVVLRAYSIPFFAKVPPELLS